VIDVDKLSGERVVFGASVTFSDTATGAEQRIQIVGEVGDVRSESVSKPPVPEVFLPMTQTCWGFGSLVVRARQDPGALGGTVRAAVAAVDSNLPLDAARPLRSLVDDSLADRRLQARLLGAFSLLALVLAATGIYGVMAYSVSRRVQEIGIRIALGAHGADIMRQFLIEAVTLSSLGGTLGILLGLATSTLLSRFAGWPTLTSVNAIVIAFLFSAAVGVFFGLYPAKKAAALDPIDALRYE
jgi:predicted lysophospholipase L1 biosynthesis ABC-type transport system permease subunit